MSVLAINPGSTSTKLAVFENGRCLASTELQHDKDELARFSKVADQFGYRMEAVRAFLAGSGTDPARLAAVAGRGGLLHPVSGGVYAVSEAMVDDLRNARYGEHPCNLGALLARSAARDAGVPAFVVDPAVTDELMDTARMTGLPAISRRSLFHALNQRGVARMVAARLGVDYAASDFIVCHMGGGISVGAHRHGRVVDVVNGLDGEGPFTSERTGGLPLLPVLGLLRRGDMDLDELEQTILKKGGLFAHLGTNDPREVVARMEAGDDHARLVFNSLAYAVAKHVGSMVPALADERGRVNIAAVIVTGGAARSEPLVAELVRMIGHIGPVEVVPGEMEMASLAAGAERALRGKETVREYISEHGRI
ncbi:MAG: butyrate kinase [Desulfovibrionaceae bacterium]|nr:butyrate kinase [Desulfovibrionaceae bacterium]